MARTQNTAPQLSTEGHEAWVAALDTYYGFSPAYPNDLYLDPRSRRIYCGSEYVARAGQDVNDPQQGAEWASSIGDLLGKVFRRRPGLATAATIDVEVRAKRLRPTYKRSTELAQGDVVLCHGMRVLLDDPAARHTYERQGSTVVSWVGHVLNVSEVAGVVPPSFIADGTWCVQGNDLARWAVEPTEEDWDAWEVARGELAGTPDFLPCAACTQAAGGDPFDEASSIEHAVVRLGAVAQETFDPTQTYVLSCGHVVI